MGYAIPPHGAPLPGVLPVLAATAGRAHVRIPCGAHGTCRQRRNRDGRAAAFLAHRIRSSGELVRERHYQLSH